MSSGYDSTDPNFDYRTRHKQSQSGKKNKELQFEASTLSVELYTSAKAQMKALLRAVKKFGIVLDMPAKGKKVSNTQYNNAAGAIDDARDVVVATLKRIEAALKKAPGQAYGKAASVADTKAQELERDFKSSKINTSSQANTLHNKGVRIRQAMESAKAGVERLF